MLDYLRERDERLREVQEQLNQALLTLGKQSTLLEGTQSLRDELDAVKRERDELQAQIRRRPWWRKLLG
jgi:ABC-type transporter Mla subunit MlaD